MQMVARGRRALERARPRRELKARVKFNTGRIHVLPVARVAVLFVTWCEGSELAEVHHVNHDRGDDRLSNLTCLTRSEHALRHCKAASRFRLCAGCWTLFVNLSPSNEAWFCSRECHWRSVGGNWRGGLSPADWAELSFRNSTWRAPPLPRHRCASCAAVAKNESRRCASSVSEG